MEKIIVVCVLLPALLTACSSSAPLTSTPVPAATFTVVPTLTAMPAPTDTPLPPTQTPAAASEWNGIPIMPEAVAGDGDEESYVFTIQSPPQQIQEYYERELEKLGWRLSAKETGSNSLILTFTDAASTTLTVSMITKNDEALVLLVK